MKSKHYLFFLLLIAAVILISSCSDASANPDEVWHTYENQDHGYSFSHPSECTYGPLPVDCKSAPPGEQQPECLCFLNPENPDRVVMQAFQNDGDQLVLAEFSVARLNAPAANPPDETGLIDWLAENFPEQCEHAEADNINIDGVSAVSIFSSASEMAPAIQEIYFIHTDQLLKISMLNPDVAVNNILYERVLSSFRFREVAQPVVVQPEGNQDTGSDLWTVYEDPEYGVRFAVPCFWEVNFPPQYHPSGTAYPIRNYSEAFSMSFGKNHEAVWENGGIKIDMDFKSGDNWGLPAEATMEDFLTVIDTDPDSVEEVLINGQKGLLITSNVQFGGGVHSYYLFKVSKNLFLSFGVYPSQAIYNPDVQGILHSLAFSPEIEVAIPEIVPGDSPQGDESACLQTFE